MSDETIVSPQENTEAANDSGTETPGAVTPSWRDGLAEEFKANEALADIESVDVLARSYLDLQGKIPVVPESPDAYQIEVPEGLPRDEALLGGFRQTAHKAGLTAEQVTAVVGWWNGYLSEQAAAVEATHKAVVADLQKEWGGKFDENLAAAKAATRAITKDDPEFRAFLDKTGLGNNKSMVKAMLRIAPLLTEQPAGRGVSGDHARAKRDGLYFHSMPD